MGRVVHRRPRRLPDAARRRAAGGVAAGRGREHDPLPAAQGHGLGAGAARRRRHRLAGARGRVLRAARGDAVHEPRPRARGGDDRLAQRGPPRAVGDVPGGRVRHVLAHRRHAPDRAALGATTSRTSASSSGACRRSGSGACRSSTPTAPGFASASTRSAPTSRCSTRGAPSRRSRTSLSRSTSRCRCGGASRRRTWASSTAAGGRCCWRSRRRPASTRSPPPTSASATSPTTRPRPGPGRTRRSRRHARRRRPGARPGCAPATPAAGETRLATFHYGSALAVGGGGYDRARVARAGAHRRARLRGRGARPRARVGRRRRRGADPRQPHLRRPATITATTRRRTRPTACSRSAPPTGRARCSSARTSSASPWSRHDRRPERSLRGGTARARGVAGRGDAAGSCCATARSSPRPATPTGPPTRRPREPDRAPPFAEVALDHCVVGPVVAVEGAVEVRANDRHRRVRGRRGGVLRPRPRGRRRALTVRPRPTARPATGSPSAAT